MPDLRILQPDSDPPRLLQLLEAGPPRRAEGRPWVMANMVASLDGRAEVAGRSGRLGGPLDRTMFQALRAVADAVLVGARTVRAERYRPLRLAPELREMRRGAGLRADPLLAVLSHSLDLPEDTGLLDDPDGLVVLAGADAPAKPMRRLRDAGVRVEQPDTGGPAGAIDHLYSEGSAVVLTEGGPSVLADIVGERRLDELCLTLAPHLLGRGLPLLDGLEPDQPAWRLHRCWSAADDLFLGYLRA